MGLGFPLSAAAQQDEATPTAHSQASANKTQVQDTLGAMLRMPAQHLMRRRLKGLHSRSRTRQQLSSLQPGQCQRSRGLKHGGARMRMRRPALLKLPRSRSRTRQRLNRVLQSSHHR